MPSGVLTPNHGWARCLGGANSLNGNLVQIMFNARGCSWYLKSIGSKGMIFLQGLLAFWPSLAPILTYTSLWG